MMYDIARITSLETLAAFTEHFSLLSSVSKLQFCVSYLPVLFIELRTWLYEVFIRIVSPAVLTINIIIYYHL
jgi:hypothetical protein